MFNSWKLGRVRGIEVFLHPTLLLVLAYYSATAGPGMVAIVAAVFGCVFLHEMGHALAARLYGIETASITLYPIGGVAALERMPRSAGPELLIAIAGPAVNFAIAAVIGALLATGYAIGVHPNRFLAVLLSVNLGLGLFNLLPIFPMDGGRVLRALLSGKLGRARATVAAAGLGQTLALVGGIYFLANGMIQPVLLAVFVYIAAGTERARVLSEESWRSNDMPRSAWPEPPFGFRWTRPRQAGRVEPILIRVVGSESPRPWR